VSNCDAVVTSFIGSYVKGNYLLTQSAVQGTEITSITFITVYVNVHVNASVHVHVNDHDHVKVHVNDNVNEMRSTLTWSYL
jgi:hypothetical protein